MKKKALITVIAAAALAAPAAQADAYRHGDAMRPNDVYRNADVYSHPAPALDVKGTKWARPGDAYRHPRDVMRGTKWGIGV